MRVSSINPLQRWILTVAAVFILLGAGNISIGFYKTKQYDRLLSRLSREQRGSRKEREVTVRALVLNRTVALDSKSRYISRIKQRKTYYQLVETGGRVFLAVAGVCLLASLVVGRRAGCET